MKKALRFNDGKDRLGLIPPFAREQIAKILTYGADKYTVGDVKGDNNWKNGLDWTGVIDSLERHLNKFKACKDYDEETKALHIAHVAVNAIFLTEYHKIAPQKDDRWRRPIPRIGLDIDEVLADFTGGFNRWFDVDYKWHSWNVSYGFDAKFKEIEGNTDFWMGLEKLIEPQNIPFEPTCYITKRPIPSEVTQGWLEKNGFPAAPVITVDGSKVHTATEYKLDVFIDDNYNTFRELTNAGVACYLMDRLHNRRYDVGYRRIKHIGEVLDLLDTERIKFEWKSAGNIAHDPVKEDYLTHKDKLSNFLGENEGHKFSLDSPIYFKR